MLLLHVCIKANYGLELCHTTYNTEHLHAPKCKRMSKYKVTHSKVLCFGGIAPNSSYLKCYWDKNFTFPFIFSIGKLSVGGKYFLCQVLSCNSNGKLDYFKGNFQVHFAPITQLKMYANHTEHFDCFILLFDAAQMIRWRHKREAAVQNLSAQVVAVWVMADAFYVLLGSLFKGILLSGLSELYFFLDFEV